MLFDEYITLQAGDIIKEKATGKIFKVESVTKVDTRKFLILNLCEWNGNKPEPTNRVFISNATQTDIINTFVLLPRGCNL